MVKVSVVMTMFNTPLEYLEPTVKSVLNQSFKDFEFIIIDDSTQEYESFFASFNDSRIRYVKNKENFGPGHARNEGIKIAQGEYVAIVDSDDVYESNRLAEQVRFLDANPDIGLVGAAFKYSTNGKVPSNILDPDELAVAMLFNAQIANPLAMFRRELFAHLNLFYPKMRQFAEDYELWAFAMLSGVKMANLDQVLMTYTRRPGQLTKSKDNLQVDGLKSVYRKILTKFGVDFGDEDVEIHYNIYAQEFKSLTFEQVNNWFDKLVSQNKVNKVLSEEKLLDYKNEVLAKMEKFRNRLFKLKVGQYNLCLSKKMQIYLEKRD